MLTTRKVDARRVAFMAAERARKIGERAKERRIELGLSQSAVAGRIPAPSVSKDYISRWELGKVEVSEGYLDDLAAALETTVFDLMGGPVSERKGTTPTPDVLGPMNRDDQLDRIERILVEIRDALLTQRPATAAEVEALELVRRLGEVSPKRKPLPGESPEADSASDG